MLVSIARTALLIAPLLAAACAERTEPYSTTTRPVEARFGASLPAGTTAWSNKSLADVFTKLTHDLEWGSTQANLLRFEAPVRVAMIGDGSESYQLFLAEFLRIIRKEARIDIQQTSPDKANLLVRFVPGDEFRDLTAAQCIVVNDHPTWSEYKSDPDGYGADAFERNKTLEKASALIPRTLEPYKIRECILEEVSQALGTGNDLYGLRDTIFNDDDAHTWPTRLDYLMLRVLYDPRMETGLNRRETTERARIVLDDINPQGRDVDTPPLPEVRQFVFLQWRNGLHRLLLSKDLSDLDRTKRARVLIDQAQRTEPNSAYHCTAAATLAQILVDQEADDKLQRIREARTICSAAHGADDIRNSQISLLEVRALNDEKRFKDALNASDGLEQVFLAHGKEGSLIATYVQIMLAHAKLNNDDARDAFIDRLRDWGAFSLGTDHKIVERLRGF
ncbi:MAG: DUF2927 domain-containing protein [Pseudomonadota bacterium]